jgi:hypothetical protein
MCVFGSGDCTMTVHKIKRKTQNIVNKGFEDIKNLTNTTRGAKKAVIQLLFIMSESTLKSIF